MADGARTHDNRNHNLGYETSVHAGLPCILWNKCLKLGHGFTRFPRHPFHKNTLEFLASQDTIFGCNCWVTDASRHATDEILCCNASIAVYWGQNPSLSGNSACTVIHKTPRAATKPCSHRTCRSLQFDRPCTDSGACALPTSAFSTQHGKQIRKSLRRLWSPNTFYPKVETSSEITTAIRYSRSDGMSYSHSNCMFRSSAIAIASIRPTPRSSTLKPNRGST